MLAGMLLCLMLLLCPIEAPSQPDHGHAARVDWVPTFEDDFQGQALDTTKWIATEGTYETRENPVHYFLPTAVSEQKGFLRIRAEQRDTHGFPYVSGEIKSLPSFCQRYGRYEVRCRYPQAPGTWCAVFLLPTSGIWPPEIDITEYIASYASRIALTNHWRDTQGEHAQANFDIVDTTQDWTKWHTYALEWEPSEIRWYIDGVLKGKTTQNIPDVPMTLCINMAIGGTYAGDPDFDHQAQFFDIDYIRVYRRKFAGTGCDVPEKETGIAHLLHQASVENSNECLLLLLAGIASVPALLAKLRLRLVMTILSVGLALSGFDYMLWRWQSINWEYGWILLPPLMAEAFKLVHLGGFLYTAWPGGSHAADDLIQNPTVDGTQVSARPPKTDAINDAMLAPNNDFDTDGSSPDRLPIYILIPTVNEGREIVERTVRGALATKSRYLEAYPHAQITVAICNDGRVAGAPNWQEMHTLAEELQVCCVTREVRGGAKAGNIEHARQYLNIPALALLAIFDADMVAEPDFLIQMIPHFANTSVGWVQSGQYYRNLDNPVARWANEQQAIFYNIVCQGKAARNACFLCGTNFVIRVAALNDFHNRFLIFSII